MPSPHVIVIGGSSGIGLAAARQLLSLRLKVTVTGRNEERLKAARANLSGDVATAKMDASRTQQVRDFFGNIGSFDHLILALGSGKGLGSFASVSVDEVREGVAEKFLTHFACAQAAVPFLRKDGSITFISAVTAHAAMPGTAGIGAANAAVAALVPILAKELRPLRVNGVSPGVVDTPWWDFLPGEQKTAVFSDYASKSLVGRVGRPEDLAQAIAFLVTNTFMSGHTIICDGGLHLAG
jgi:NAD(P)-dependent dehydrogenase (short-subunit alcohol dehydrogenase family)